MQARICDACKKIIIPSNTKRIYWGVSYFELCPSCSNIVSKLKEEYEEEEKKLYEERGKLEEKYKNKLREVGIDFE